MKPGNAPPRCPRGTDDSSGPRRCRFTSCPLHLAHLDDPSVNTSGARWRAARELEDTCTADLAERAAASRVRAGVACMSLREIATVLGTDAASVLRSYRRATRKVKLRVIVDGR